MLFSEEKKSLLCFYDSIYFLLNPCLYTLIMSKMSGKITYNGHGLKEFVPQRTSAYVSQQDWHVAEMTVRETLDLSARCQGVGFKYGKFFYFVFFLYICFFEYKKAE